MALTTNARSRVSPRLVISYIIDWVIVIAIAAIGGGFSRISGNRRPFSLIDSDISYPHVLTEKISTAVLFVLSLIFPAAVIFLQCLLLVPGPTAPKTISKTRIWGQKFWELNSGLLGLCLGCAVTFMFTEGMKSLFGKPRPDLLSRCDPDIANLAQYVVGGIGDGVPEGNFLVSAAICKQTDSSILRDGFASFPSGHSSFSFAGLTYLALYISSKLRFSIPYLLPYSYSNEAIAGGAAFSSTSTTSDGDTELRSYRHQAAAPPLTTLIVPLVPVCLAVYISSTRYSDFRHHGFDIIFGALMGFVFAWTAFRLYHMPIRRAAGWSWGPRGEGRAFGIGVGVEGYGLAGASLAGHTRAEKDAHERLPNDLEQGRNEVGTHTNGGGPSSTAI